MIYDKNNGIAPMKSSDSKKITTLFNKYGPKILLLETIDICETEADASDPCDLRFAAIAETLKCAISELDKKIPEVEKQMSDRKWGIPIADVWLAWMKSLE